MESKEPIVSPRMAAANAKEEVEKKMALWYYKNRKATFQQVADHFGTGYDYARDVCNARFEWAKGEVTNG
jgi:hypothetical protein